MALTLTSLQRKTKMATLSSLQDRLQGLGTRLQAENEAKSRERMAPGFNLELTRERPGSERRPKPALTIDNKLPMRPNTISGRQRERPKIELPLLFEPRQQQSDLPELDAHVKEITRKNGNLVIESKSYKSSIEDMEYISELGNGTSGNVVKMLHKSSKKVIAVKQMRRSGNLEETKRVFFDLEVVLKSDCPFIVQCLGCFITDSDVWICMELMATCLDKLTKRYKKPIPEPILGKISVATLKALNYLKESHGVIHRDVKPSNILLDERGNIKLCDFGISGRLVDSKAKTRSAGCAAYMAPERIDPPDPNKPDYDIRADVWSLGITLVELATGQFPYKDCRNDFEVLTKVLQDDPPSLPKDGTFSSEFCDFVNDCLIKEYRLRPKYKKLLDYAFIKKYEQKKVDVSAWFADVCRATDQKVRNSPQRVSIFSSPLLSRASRSTSRPPSVPSSGGGGGGGGGSGGGDATLPPPPVAPRRRSRTPEAHSHDRLNHHPQQQQPQQHHSSPSHQQQNQIQHQTEEKSHPSPQKYHLPHHLENRQREQEHQKQRHHHHHRHKHQNSDDDGDGGGSGGGGGGVNSPSRLCDGNSSSCCSSSCSSSNGSSNGSSSDGNGVVSRSQLPASPSLTRAVSASPSRSGPPISPAPSRALSTSPLPRTVLPSAHPPHSYHGVSHTGSFPQPPLSAPHQYAVPPTTQSFSPFNYSPRPYSHVYSQYSNPYTQVLPPRSSHSSFYNSGCGSVRDSRGSQGSCSGSTQSSSSGTTSTTNTTCSGAGTSGSVREMACSWPTPGGQREAWGSCASSQGGSATTTSVSQTPPMHRKTPEPVSSRYPPTYLPPHVSPLVSRRKVENRTAATTTANGSSHNHSHPSQVSTAAPLPGSSAGLPPAPPSLTTPHYRYTQEAYYNSRPYYTPEPQRRIFPRLGNP
ncbi:dual specificity mitogen-activated protein kinase kinase hemipterous-like isoform X1 [Portunus trituberculatus]|uniref:dual specificity mitogen-activated protein kinase kinase hemipterous-like isoform X1 n=1 Tax=Portunus trituberculatus TaxID=210409 RepID=UPI001E1CD90F|nr:dual specificity mitogen-activated protein kinase kinase hemipterous-like isoform X1 [Portunus trituberculatus]